MSELEGNTPINPDFALRINIEDGTYILVSPSMDAIQRFDTDEYDYLRYYDTDDQKMKAFFLGQAALSELVELGIPETYREFITETEYELYEAVNQLVQSKSEEVVIKETANLDAELDYYLGEWLE